MPAPEGTFRFVRLQPTCASKTPHEKERDLHEITAKKTNAPTNDKVVGITSLSVHPKFFVNVIFVNRIAQVVLDFTSCKENIFTSCSNNLFEKPFIFVF